MLNCTATMKGSVLGVKKGYSNILNFYSDI